MFLYTVSFPSAVWYLSRRPRCRLCTGEPPEDIPPDLQSGAESKREGGREKDTLMEVSPRHTHTPLTQLPSRRPSLWSRCPRGCIHDARKGGYHGATFISTRMPTTCLEPGLDLPWHPTCRETRLEKAYAPIACPTPAVTLMTRL